MKKQLIEILQQTANMAAEDFNDARRVQQEKGGNIGDILIRRKLITESQFLEALSIQYNMPFWSRIPADFTGADVISKIPIQFLKKHFIVPLQTNGNQLHQKPEEGVSPEAPDAQHIASSPKIIIAVNDPAEFQALDDVIRILGIRNYEIVLSTKESIMSSINISYDLHRDSAEQLVQDMEDNDAMIISEFEDTADLLDDTSDAPIIKLVNHIISQASKARASDIHIEPYQNSFKVRYRVDGILHDFLTPPKWIQASLVSRIKVMAKMNIAEKRLPQDGRLEVKIGDQAIDVRLSTIPTAFGERVVMRLLNKSSSLLKLTELGIAEGTLNLLKNYVTSPNGIILITGPTGSGKTTTLYAILSYIISPDINIITIEDPVEYQLAGISQIQVNPKIELTFARGLRHIVRQDPDVILIGEIRDLETAEIAVQSALTGHLVFSTLHTNDSASAITRLVDLGVEPFLISSSVIAVGAQRLIRILCPHCKEPYKPDSATLTSLGLSPNQLKNNTVYRAKGCPICFNTGYHGRMIILEIMPMTDTLKTLILKSFDSNEIKKEASKGGIVSMRQDGILKILDGLTTIEEVIRVTQK